MDTHCDISKCYGGYWKNSILRSHLEKLHETIRHYEFIAINQDIMSMLLNVLNQFTLSDEIKFRVFDNFDLFVMKNFRLLHEAFSLRVVSQRTMDGMWAEAVADFSQKLPLYMFALIQLVAKMVDKNSLLAVVSVLDMLRINFNKTCDEAMFFQAEMDVFRTLDFEIVVPIALDTIDMTYQVCIRNTVHDNPDFYEATINLLYFVYFEREEIYRRLVPHLKCETTLVEIKTDKRLLGIGVIYSTANINRRINKKQMALLMSQLHEESGKCKNDIRKMAKVIKAVQLERHASLRE